MDNIKEIFNNFQNDLNEEYNIRKISEIYNPIPDSDNNTIIPEYLKEYGPTDDTNTTLGIINYELSTFEPYTLGTIGDIIDIIALDKETTDSVVGFLNDIVDSVDKNIKEIDNQIGNVIKNFDQTLDGVNDISRLVMNILFGVNLGLVLSLTISLLIIFFLKRCHFLLCFNWSLLYIFMLLSLLIGAVFLVLGLFLQNLSYGISNIIHNIKDIETSSTFSQIGLNVIDVCFNGKGLLAESDIFPKEFNTTIVESIYSIEENYKNEIIDIENYKFVSTKIAEEKYDDFQNRPKKYINNLVISLNNIQTYIDITVNDTKVSSETPFYDEWEMNKDDCKEGYEYLPKNSSNSNMGGFLEEKKSCLVITEWEKNEILDRYKNIKLIDESISITEIVNKYYDAILYFSLENEDLINKIKNKNKEFDNNFISVKTEIIAMLNNILNIVRPLREVFSDIVGNGSIFEILNCNFLKRDFNKLMEVLYNEFGSTFRRTSDLFFSNCVFQIVMTLLILVIIASIKEANKENIPRKSDNEDFLLGLRDSSRGDYQLDN